MVFLLNLICVRPRFYFFSALYQKQYTCTPGDESLSGTGKDGFDPNTGQESAPVENTNPGPSINPTQSNSGAEDELNVFGQSDRSRPLHHSSSDPQDSAAPGSSGTGPPQASEAVLSPVDGLAEAFISEAMDSAVEDTTTLNTGSDQSDGRKNRDKPRKSVTIAVELDDVRTGLRQSETGVNPQQPGGAHAHPQCHFRFSEFAPQPPSMLHAATVSANGPLLPTTANIDLAAAGGGIVTNEKSNGLPLHTNDLETLRPHLVHFCHAYNVQMVIHRIASLEKTISAHCRHLSIRVFLVF